MRFLEHAGQGAMTSGCNTFRLLEVLAGELDKLLPVTVLKGPATIPVRDILERMSEFLEDSCALLCRAFEPTL